MGLTPEARDSVKSANCHICKDGASAKGGPGALCHLFLSFCRKRLFH